MRVMTPILAVDAFRSLVAAGIAAPSADNRHPLRFEHAGDTVVVRDASGAASRPFHRQVLFLIALGAVVENMIVHAGAMGLEATADLLPRDAGRDVVAVLRVRPARPGARASNALARAIPERHTNRRFFKGPPLDRGHLDELAREVESVPGARLVFLDTATARKAALRLVRAAEGERFRDPALHRELFSSVRFDLGWRTAADEGLAPGSLEIERPLRGAFAALRHRGMAGVMRATGSATLLGMRAGDLPCRRAPHMGVIASPLELAPGALAAGRGLERLWLAVTAMGLAFQPLAASTLFALDGYIEVRPALRRKLQQGWAALTPGLQPHIVFRIGRARPPSLRNARRPLDSYIRGVEA